VRRLLLAAALALVFHILLFSIRFEGPKAKLIQPPRPLTLSLAQGPAEPLPSLAVSGIIEPQDPPRFYRPRPKEEQTQRQKTRKSEKSPKGLEEQAGPSTASPVSLRKSCVQPRKFSTRLPRRPGVEVNFSSRGDSSLPPEPCTRLSFARPQARLPRDRDHRRARKPRGQSLRLEPFGLQWLFSIGSGCVDEREVLAFSSRDAR
jgi:hypothetical protein